MRVEFLLTNVMEVSHFAPIGHALRSLEAVVSMAPAHSRHLSTEFGWSDLEAVVAAIEREEFKATNPDKTADVIICTFPTQSLRSFYSGITVRMQYGVGLVDPKSDHPMGEESDYYLVHGPFGVRTQFTMHGMPSPLIPWERVKAIGYPKLDRFYSTQKVPNSKPVLLWLPTWSVRSSIERYLEAIIGLSAEFHVAIKPHHCTTRWEEDRVRRLDTTSAQLLDNSFDSAGLYVSADLILADLSSGAFTEALLIGKPVVGLSSKEERTHLLLDNDALLPGVTGPEFLRKEIEYIKHFMWDSEALETLRDDLFTTTRGHDAEVAAKIIMELR